MKSKKDVKKEELTGRDAVEELVLELIAAKPEHRATEASKILAYMSIPAFSSYVWDELCRTRKNKPLVGLAVVVDMVDAQGKKHLRSGQDPSLQILTLSSIKTEAMNVLIKSMMKKVMNGMIAVMGDSTTSLLCKENSAWICRRLTELNNPAKILFAGSRDNLSIVADMLMGRYRSALSSGAPACESQVIGSPENDPEHPKPRSPSVDFSAEKAKGVARTPSAENAKGVNRTASSENAKKVKTEETWHVVKCVLPRSSTGDESGVGDCQVAKPEHGSAQKLHVVKRTNSNNVGEPFRPKEEERAEELAMKSTLSSSSIDSESAPGPGVDDLPLDDLNVSLTGISNTGVMFSADATAERCAIEGNCCLALAQAALRDEVLERLGMTKDILIGLIHVLNTGTEWAASNAARALANISYRPENLNSFGGGGLLDEEQRERLLLSLALQVKDRMRNASKLYAVTCIANMLAHETLMAGFLKIQGLKEDLATLQNNPDSAISEEAARAVTMMNQARLGTISWRPPKRI